MVVGARKLRDQVEGGEGSPKDVETLLRRTSQGSKAPPRPQIAQKGADNRQSS